MEYTIKQLADHVFPRPPAGGRGPGGRGRSCRKRHGQGVAPAQGRRGASKTPPPRRSAARQRHDKHRRARPTEGGGQGQGRDPARRRGDPRQPTDKHARDRDQGGAGASKPPRRILAGAICEQGAGPQGHARPTPKKPRASAAAQGQP